VTSAAPPIPGYAPLPLIGAKADLLRFFADPLRHLLALEQQFGSVAAMTAGNTSLMFAFGAAHNQTVLSDAATFRNFVEVPFPVPPGSAATRMFAGIMSMNGDQHRQHRRMLLPVVSKTTVATYADDIVAVTDRYVDRWGSGAPFDVIQGSAALTSEVLMRCLFDNRSGPGEERAEIGRISMQLLGRFSSPMTIIMPWRIPGLPYTRFLETCEEAETMMRAMIADRRREPAGRRDVMSILLRERDEEVGGLSDDQVIAHLVTMVFAGQDTMASTLSLTLLLLSQYPAITGALGEEIDRVLGGEPPTPAAMAQLPLLDGVLQESMRVFPAIVHLLFRQPNAERRLGAHVIPAGAVIILSPLVTHRDPEVFPDPLRFDPSRWQAGGPGPYAYLPFGAGPRTCLGAALASYILRAQLVRILQRYRPVVAPHTRVDLVVRAANLATRGPLPIRLVPRSAASSRPEPVTGDLRRLVRLP